MWARCICMARLSAARRNALTTHREQLFEERQIANYFPDGIAWPDERDADVAQIRCGDLRHCVEERGIVGCLLTLLGKVDEVTTGLKAFVSNVREICRGGD